MFSFFSSLYLYQLLQAINTCTNQFIRALYYMIAEIKR
jgi:hypothetical protein